MPSETAVRGENPSEGNLELSVLVTCRNREIALVTRHIGGLRKQTFKRYELIFVDSGSEPGLAQAYQTLVTSIRHGRYICSDTTGRFWNKSQAINTAARHACGQYLLTLDVDLILHETVLEELMRKAAVGTVLCARFFKLPKYFDAWHKLEALDTKRLHQSEGNASGAVQVVSRETFYTLRGPDEHFVFWGAEDVDFTSRLARSGQTICWVNTSPIFHQWHSTRRDLKMPEGWWIAMNVRLGLGARRLVRNACDWGKTFQTSERVSLQPKPGEWRREFVFPRRRMFFPNSAKIWLPVMNAFEMAYLARSLATELEQAPSGGVVVCRIKRSVFREMLYKILFSLKCQNIDGRKFCDLPHDILSICWKIFCESNCCDDYRVSNFKTETVFLFRKGERSEKEEGALI